MPCLVSRSNIQENFDYQDIRRDFVRGILESDLLGKTIYCQVETDAYAMRVSNSSSYDSVSKDVMARWSYPMTPESPIFGSQHSLVGSSVYKGARVFLSRYSSLVGRVVIGSETRIGDGTIVKNSVIGRNCVIGNNVFLENVYLWDNVHIEDSTQVRHSIITQDCVIGQECKVEAGGLVASGVRIESGQVIAQHTSLCRPGNEYNPDACTEVGSRMALWKTEYDEEHESFDERNLLAGELARDMSVAIAQENGQETDSESEAGDSENELDQESERKRECLPLSLII